MLPLKELNLNVARKLEGRGDYKGALKFYALAQSWEDEKRIRREARAKGILTDTEELGIYDKVFNIWEEQRRHERTEATGTGYGAPMNKTPNLGAFANFDLSARRGRVIEIARAHAKAGDYIRAIGVCRENGLTYPAGRFAEDNGLFSEAQELFRAGSNAGDEARVALKIGASPEEIVSIYREAGWRTRALKAAREHGLHGEEAQILEEDLRRNDMHERGCRGY